MGTQNSDHCVGTQPKGPT